MCHEGCDFSGGTKYLLWDMKDQSDFFLETPIFFHKIFFWDTEKLFLTFSEVIGVSSIVKLFLTNWKVKSGKERSATQKRQQKQDEQQETQHKEVEAAHKTESKTAETTAQAETKKQQQQAHTAASCTNSSNFHKQQLVIQGKTTAQTAAKAAKAAANTEATTGSRLQKTTRKANIKSSKRSTESSNGSSTNMKNSSEGSEHQEKQYKHFGRSQAARVWRPEGRGGWANPKKVETKLHVQLLACAPFQLSAPQ